MRIKLRPKPVFVGSDRASFPEVMGTIRAGGQPSGSLRFIVDSGAAATLLPWWVAAAVGIDAALASAPTATFAGLTGTQPARRAVVDLEVAGYMLLATPVYFVPEVAQIAGRDGLLGQLGFFDRVRFVQRHEHKPPYFYLDW